MFTRVGKKVLYDEAADLQYVEEHEDDVRRTNVHARLGSRRVHDRLGDNAYQAKALQGLVVEEFMIDLADSAPQAKALQARISRKVGASAAKGSAHPQVTPRITGTKKQDTGSPREDIAMKRTKICPCPGAAKRLTHSLVA